MKRFLLYTGVLFALSIKIQAQAKLGFKLIPSISSSRVYNNSDSLEISKFNSKFRAGLGLVADIGLTEYYYLNTGINFMPKYVSMNVTNLNDNTVSTESFLVNYLQIPFGLKLFTNEISEGMQLHFKAGTSLDIKLSDIKEKKGKGYLRSINPVDMTLHIGVGGEKKLGENTAFFGSFVYYRGLFNTIKSSVEVQDPFVANADMFAFEVGVKF